MTNFVRPTLVCAFGLVISCSTTWAGHGDSADSGHHSGHASGHNHFPSHSSSKHPDNAHVQDKNGNHKTKSANGANSGKKQPKVFRDRVNKLINKGANNQVKLSNAETGALNRVMSGGSLSEQDRTNLSDLIMSDRDGLTEADRDAVAQALDDDAERPDRGMGDKAVAQLRRYVKIENKTGERLTLSVQYRTKLDNGKWAWVPGEPGDSTEALQYEFEPGESAVLQNHRGPIGANRVRLWATSKSGKTALDYKERDLWVVPEVDDNDQHCYFAEEMETFHVVVYPPNSAGDQLRYLVRR